MEFFSDLTATSLDELKNTLEYYRRFTQYGITSALMEKQLLLMLERQGSFLPFFPLQSGEIRQNIYRLTINKNVVKTNKRIRNLKLLKYPPPESVKNYGRCNLPGKSVFYGTFDHITLLNETRPQPGDLVTISKWKPKGKSFLVFCPIFMNQPVSGNTINPRSLEKAQLFDRAMQHYPKEYREKVNIVYQFFTDEFSKPLPTNDRDYLFSAFYSDKILSGALNGRIDAIHYPSVRQGLSFENIAIKSNVFDALYDIEHVEDGMIDLRGRFIQQFNHCENFSTSGQILWDTEVHWPAQQLLLWKQQYGLDLS